MSVVLPAHLQGVVQDVFEQVVHHPGPIQPSDLFGGVVWPFFVADGHQLREVFHSKIPPPQCRFLDVVHDCAPFSQQLVILYSVLGILGAIYQGTIDEATQDRLIQFGEVLLYKTIAGAMVGEIHPNFCEESTKQRGCIHDDR
jgi:hypothetical protein